MAGEPGLTGGLAVESVDGEFKLDPGPVTPHHLLEEEKTVKEIRRKGGSVTTPALQVAQVVIEKVKFDTKKNY